MRGPTGKDRTKPGWLLVAVLVATVVLTLPTAVWLGRNLPAALAMIGTGREDHVVSLFDGYIPLAEQAAIEAGSSTYDATEDIQAAIADVEGAGKTLLFPSGTYLVREIVFSGRDYSVATAGVTFQQKPGLTGDDQIHPIITFAPGSSDIRVGDLELRGNIDSDAGEYSHGVAVLSAKRIALGDIRGKDIRGDVLYTYGRTTSAAERQSGLTTGIVRGDNVLRCIVAMAGGEARIAGIVQEGPVGYRTFDAEPNAGGAYQPVEAEIGFIRGSTVQMTSDDPETMNGRIAIGVLELDGDRLANSTPGHPSYPGRNAIALAINRTRAVEIGSLSVRRYPSYPVQLGERWQSVRIGRLAFEDADTVEETYKSIVLQHGAAGDGVLEIGEIAGRLAGPDRFALRSDRGRLRVAIGYADVRGGLFGAYLDGQVKRFAGGSSRDCIGCEGLRTPGPRAGP